MKLCEYGCGQEAKYHFKNGKWCCSENVAQCPESKKKIGLHMKTRIGPKNSFYGKKHTEKTKEKISKNRKGKLIGESHPLFGKSRTVETRKKIGIANKGNKHTIQTKEKISSSLRGKKHKEETKRKIGLSQKGRNILKNIKILSERYPLLFQIEGIKEEKETRKILVKCKNSSCENSKRGWFYPTYSQLYERNRAIVNPIGFEENNFYCCQECKDKCNLYKIRTDPFKEIKTLYTQEEYQIFRCHVLERDNYKCQYCGKDAVDVHHERPQKLEPLFVLDPDFAWSCCEVCHYKKGHPTGSDCSTGNIASKICN